MASSLGTFTECITSPELIWRMLRKALRRAVNFVIAQASGPSDLGFFRWATWVLFIGAYQLEAFLLIVGEKVITQNAVPHLPHQAMIERQVVQSQQVPP